jgi:hypothetical protein
MTSKSVKDTLNKKKPTKAHLGNKPSKSELSLSLSPLTARVDFGPTKEARQRSILNKLELHLGLLKAGGGYKGV